MIQLGLAGYPLDHSLSPRIHAAALRSCGLQGDYSLFPIAADDLQGLHDLLARLRSGEISGLNVTIPHKQNVMQFLDELTPRAKAIGAVNTIYLRDDIVIGDNTDAPGFLADLNNFPGRNQSEIERRKSALILGAGGSARAVAYALTHGGWTVSIAARHIEQAQRIAARFSAHEIDITDQGLTKVDLSKIGLIVNATPVGMAPNVDDSPWPEGLPFPPGAAVYDLVYNPRETKLVKEAWAAGIPATTGAGMLIVQAALAFEIWTGTSPSREVLLESIHH